MVVVKVRESDNHQAKGRNWCEWASIQLLGFSVGKILDSWGWSGMIEITQLVRDTAKTRMKLAILIPISFQLHYIAKSLSTQCPWMQRIYRSEALEKTEIDCFFHNPLALSWAIFFSCVHASLSQDIGHLLWSSILTPAKGRSMVEGQWPQFWFQMQLPSSKLGLNQDYFDSKTCTMKCASFSVTMGAESSGLYKELVCSRPSPKLVSLLPHFQVPFSSFFLCSPPMQIIMGLLLSEHFY